MTRFFRRVHATGVRDWWLRIRRWGGDFAFLGEWLARTYDADETAPLALDSPIPYCRTKALAEHAVREADDSANGFTTIVLRPRFIWGPGDTTLLPGIAAMAQRGAWMWINRGAAVTSTTHISNLVEAIALACERGEGGEAYFVLDDGIHTLREIISGMAASRELTLPDRSIPAWVADAAGAVCEWVWRTLSLKDAPPLTKQIAMLMSRDCTLCDDKARAQLGYVPVVSVDDGLRELREASPASAKRY